MHMDDDLPQGEEKAIAVEHMYEHTGFRQIV